MELYVFDMELNRLGVVDDFIKLEIQRHYRKMSQLSLRLDGTSDYIELLQEGRILVPMDDLQHGYLIETREYLDEKSSVLEIYAPSLNSLLNRRIILGQQEFSGNVENVIKSFVQLNAVNPSNRNRILPNLAIATNQGLGIETTEAASNKPLDEYTYDMCNKHDMSWDINLDYDNKKFVFTTWQGLDRSTEQSINSHIIFSKEFDNVLSQNYVESNSDYKSTAIVAGEGEGAARTYVTVNNEVSGLERCEVFVDARDLQSSYRDDNDNEVTLSSTEYRNILTERGKEKLSEYKTITTFESEIDIYSQFRYGTDYFLGDKVSVVNNELNIIIHTRVISSVKTYERQRESLDIAFGDNIPTLIDKLKRTVK